MSRALSLATVVVTTASLLAIAAPSQAALKAGAERGIEQNMLVLVNTYRSQHGLAPLQSSSALMRAAREHSRDMVEHNYFDHTSLTGEAFSQRLTRFGFRWTSAGETIAEASGLSSSTAAASSAVTMWRKLASAQPHPPDRKLPERRDRRPGARRTTAAAPPARSRSTPRAASRPYVTFTSSELSAERQSGPGTTLRSQAEACRLRDALPGADRAPERERTVWKTR